jgi:2-polyprenyl-6-methoxyphenol hydroxylase-like FAD-dependent oxidoreductase
LESLVGRASEPLLVVGGGIGGLVLATALGRRGVDYRLLERAPVIDPIGAGLLLSPNATRLLGKLDLLDDVLRLGRATRRWRILDDRGRVLRELTMPKGDAPGVSIHRADLQHLLLRALPAGRITLGRAVVDVEREGEALRVVCDDGGRVVAGAVVGADGLRSRVRAAILGDGEPVYRGYVGWRGIARGVPAGWEAMLSESWGPGGRFGIAPIDGERTYWYASANRPRGWTHAPADRRRDLLAWFGRWHEPVAALIEGTPSDTILCNEIVDRPPRRGWSHGRVTLLGDAAHPMTPNLGQGACSAIEDAWVLARELAAAPSIEAAFRRYEAARYRRTASLQRRSLALGHVVQLERPWALAVRRAIARAAPAWLDRIPMEQVFRYDADAA